MSASQVIYIVGDEPTSRSKELTHAVELVLGTEDHSLALETFDLSHAAGDEERSRMIEDAVYSLSSPPFLTSRRVVVLRDIGAATSDNVIPLITYLESPCETSYLIAVQGGGRISTLLTKAWKSIVDQRGTARESIADVMARVTKELNLSFDPGVREAIIGHCGEDSSKLILLLERVHAVYGEAKKLSLEDITRYLGESGNVAIYELANEICTANTTRALEIVSRMLHSTSSAQTKPMHPLQIISLLAGHFRKLAILDDPSIRSQAEAHAALGGKGNPYGAKKSWEQARKLGSVALTSCIQIIGTTDVIVKGANAIDGPIAIELMIITLCNLCDHPSPETRSSIISSYCESLYI